MLTRPSDISAHCVSRKICRILISTHLPAFQEACVQNYFNSLLRSGREERNKACKGLSTLPMLPWFLPEMPSLNRLVIDRLKQIWKIRSLAKDAPSEALTAQHFCLFNRYKRDIYCCVRLSYYVQQEAALKVEHRGLEYEEKRTHLSCVVLFNSCSMNASPFYWIMSLFCF